MGHYRDCIRSNALRYQGYECQVRPSRKRHLVGVCRSLHGSAHFCWSLVREHNTCCRGQDSLTSA